jgi:molybdate transport system regulatory protein
MNRLPGRVSAVEVFGSIALVEVAVGAHRFSATLLGAGDEVTAWSVDMPVALLFKETEVALAKNLSGLISLRNRIPAIVRSVERGQVLTKVGLDIDGYPLTSVITTKSSHLLQLAVGDEVEGLVKANEMSIMRIAAA